MNKSHSNNKISAYTAGFTLIELMLSICIIGILASIAMTSYKSYIAKAEVSKAIADISNISLKLKTYQLDHDDYPESLSEVSMGNLLDPWGSPYEYLNLQKNGNGGARRDKNLNPLNSDFDLYSRGKDGQTKLPITQKDSVDDVLRANDGSFIDLAENYSH